MLLILYTAYLRKQYKHDVLRYLLIIATITDVIKDKIYHNNKLSSHTICQNDNWFHALKREKLPVHNKTYSSHLFAISHQIDLSFVIEIGVKFQYIINIEEL